MLLSPMSKVGLTVKTFIEIMRSRILNCRLCQSTVSLTPAVPVRASTSEYTAVHRPTVINATVQNAVFKCRL